MTNKDASWEKEEENKDKNEYEDEDEDEVKEEALLTSMGNHLG